MPRRCLVAMVRWESSEATFGQQSWCWGMDHGAEVPRADADMKGTGASVGNQLVLRLHSPCRTAYGGRTLFNTLFIKSFCI